MEEKVFVGFNYGRFKNDNGEVQSYSLLLSLLFFVNITVKKAAYFLFFDTIYGCDTQSPE